MVVANGGREGKRQVFTVLYKISQDGAMDVVRSSESLQLASICTSQLVYVWQKG